MIFPRSCSTLMAKPRRETRSWLPASFAFQHIMLPLFTVWFAINTWWIMYNYKCWQSQCFLRLAEDYCKGLMERKRLSPTHQKYQAPSTKCFFAGSALSDVVVLVNFMSAWGLFIWWNLGPNTMLVPKR